jgi:hypothetical protein
MQGHGGQNGIKSAAPEPQEQQASLPPATAAAGARAGAGAEPAAQPPGPHPQLMVMTKVPPIKAETHAGSSESEATAQQEHSGHSGGTPATAAGPPAPSLAQGPPTAPRASAAPGAAAAAAIKPGVQFLARPGGPFTLPLHLSVAPLTTHLGLGPGGAAAGAAGRPGAAGAGAGSRPGPPLLTTLLPQLAAAAAAAGGHGPHAVPVSGGLQLMTGQTLTLHGQPMLTSSGGMVVPLLQLPMSASSQQQGGPGTSSGIQLQLPQQHGQQVFQIIASPQMLAAAAAAAGRGPGAGGGPGPGAANGGVTSGTHPTLGHTLKLPPGFLPVWQHAGGVSSSGHHPGGAMLPGVLPLSLLPASHALQAGAAAAAAAAAAAHRGAMGRPPLSGRGTAGASSSGSGSSRRAVSLKGPCMHCGTTISSQWRSGPSDKPVLCNACGLYYRKLSTLPQHTCQVANQQAVSWGMLAGRDVLAIRSLLAGSVLLAVRGMLAGRGFFQAGYARRQVGVVLAPIRSRAVHGTGAASCCVRGMS